MIIVGGMGAYGCARKPSEPESADGGERLEFELNPDARVVGWNLNADSFVVTPLGVVIYGDSLNLQEGQIVAGDGFLGRILSISSSGNGWYLELEPMGLGDLFQYADIHVVRKMPFQADSLRKMASLRKSTTFEDKIPVYIKGERALATIQGTFQMPRPLGDSGSGEVFSIVIPFDAMLKLEDSTRNDIYLSIELEGRATVSMDLEFTLRSSLPGQIDYIRVLMIPQFRLEISQVVSLGIGVEIDLDSLVQQLVNQIQDRLQQLGIEVPLAGVPIGPILVVGGIEISPRCIMDLTVSGWVGVDIPTVGAFEATIPIGFEGSDNLNNLTPLFNPQFSWDVFTLPPQFRATAGLNAEMGLGLGIGPNLRILILEITSPVGVYADAQVEAQISAYSGGQQLDLNFAFGAKVGNAQVEVHVPLLEPIRLNIPGEIGIFIPIYEWSETYPLCPSVPSFVQWRDNWRKPVWVSCSG